MIHRNSIIEHFLTKIKNIVDMQVHLTGLSSLHLMCSYLHITVGTYIYILVMSSFIVFSKMNKNMKIILDSYLTLFIFCTLRFNAKYSYQCRLCGVVFTRMCKFPYSDYPGQVYLHLNNFKRQVDITIKNVKSINILS